MTEEQIKQNLRIAFALLQEADDYLTDGDEIDEIEEEGSPDLSQWAQKVRTLLEQHQET